MNQYRERVVQEIPILCTPRATLITAKPKVCAYARVSTESEQQELSYEAQCEHYTKHIGNNPEWEFAGIYADPFASGTRVDIRPGFRAMIADAKKGKIDRILVKSISRFARNTVDTLYNIRLLKELGVTVFFETQKLDTATAHGDMLLTVLAACAEQESRTISSNIRWAYAKRFKSGKVLINSFTLGYEKCGDGYAIVESEAVTVRRVFKEYLLGRTYLQIAQGLINDGIKTGAGKDKWTASSVQGILVNEKYTGNALMGKTYKTDVLSKYRKKNTGQAPQYYIQNSHDAIISQEMYDLVQQERMMRASITTTRKTGVGKYTSKHALSGLLYCKCGSKFRRHNRSLADGTKVITWICIDHQTDKDKCDMKPLKELDIQYAYYELMHNMAGDIESISKEVVKVLDEVMLPKQLNTQMADNKLADVQKEIMKLFNEKKRGELRSEDYQKQYAALSQKVIELREECDANKSEELEMAMQKAKLESITEILKNKEINYLEPRIMKSLVEKMIVLDKHTIEVVLTCGITRKIYI